MKEDPPLDARCRDKFLVQSVLVDASEETNVATLWSNVEKTSKGSIQEQKIRVQFLPAGGDSSHVNGGLAAEEHPPAYSSPTPVYGSPAPASGAKSPSGASSYSAVTSTGASTGTSTGASAGASTGLAGAAQAVSNAIPRSQEDVNAQLSAAQAKIKELTNQLSDPQVRQRKVAEAQEKVQTVVQQSQETGVPLPWVAGLCLLSFLIAWLFF